MPLEVLLNHRVNVVALLLGAMSLLPVPGQAQAPASREALLAQGWSALAAGRPADAIRAADRLLKEAPRDHEAASLGVEAALAGPDPAPALDLYERWLEARRREDPILLEEIAVGFLRELGRATEARISYGALAALARYGDADASRRLAALAKDPSLTLEAESALAEAGLAIGVDRLRTRVADGGPRDKSRAIEALKHSGQPGASAAIALALTDPAPPSRIAAAYALADLGATDAIPQLRAAASDPEPAVRAAIEIALGLLGDPAGKAALASLDASPLADHRLLAVRQAAGRDPRGNWPARAEGLLRDPDPAVRLQAAELLTAHGHGATAEPVWQAALTSPSGPLRSLAAASLARLHADERNLPIIRTMLRDPLPEVRLAGARALLISRR